MRGVVAKRLRKQAKSKEEYKQLKRGYKNVKRSTNNQ